MGREAAAAWGKGKVSKLCKLEKMKTKPKFRVRAHNRCPLCGRARGYYRKFDMCRICFRLRALKGEIPGVTKSSW